MNLLSGSLSRLLVVMTVVAVPLTVGTPSTAFNGYDDGDFPPYRLLEVAPEFPQTQTFVAEGRRFRDLQFMIAEGSDVTESLRVEVRSEDRAERYGHGVISPNGRSFGWRSVRWKTAPKLRPEETYAFVLESAATAQQSWGIAMSEANVYPWGDGPVVRFRTTTTRSGWRRINNIDLAFRARFRGGVVRDSPMRVVKTRPPWQQQTATGRTKGALLNEIPIGLPDEE